MAQTLNLPWPTISHPLIVDLVSGVISILEKESIVGFYLGGSLAMGGFDENTSDLDFLFILRKPASKSAIEHLSNLHKQLHQSNKNRLYRDYDGDYLTIDQSLHLDITRMQTLHLSTNGDFAQESATPSMVINLWKIRRFGFTVFGPSPQEVIVDISKKQMLDAKVASFQSLWLPKLINQTPMDDRYQVFAIETLSRILYGLIQKDEVPKKVATNWLASTYPQFAKLTVDANDWQPGMSFKHLNEIYGLIDLINHVTH